MPYPFVEIEVLADRLANFYATGTVVEYPCREQADIDGSTRAQRTELGASGLLGTASLCGKIGTRPSDRIIRSARIRGKGRSEKEI